MKAGTSSLSSVSFELGAIFFASLVPVSAAQVLLFVHISGSSYLSEASSDEQSAAFRYLRSSLVPSLLVTLR